MKWDCEIGGLPFLFATNQQAPYRRETAEFRRQRIDQEREVGEQSLDSGYWLRSQASFHFGSGLESAEPLGVSEAEARFRYSNSNGMNVWEPGQLSLLKDVDNVGPDATSGPGSCLAHDSGVMYFRNNQVTDYLPGLGGMTVTNSLGNIRSMTSTGGLIVFASQDKLGTYVPASLNAIAEKYSGGTVINFARWVKQRLLVADVNTLIEVTDLNPVSPPAALPSAFYTHPDGDWRWNDAAEGPAAIYAAGYSGDQSAIYAITVTDNNGALELGTPVTVAEMPRAEIVLSLYSYLGSYLIVGTSKGVRVAAIQTDGSLTLGPLLVEVDTSVAMPNGFGSLDAVAVGRYVWVTLGGTQASLYRIDLGQALDGELRFPIAPDLDVTAGDSPGTRVDGVTVTSDGFIVFAVDGQGLFFEEQGLYVTSGWLETGRIRMGTLQNKSWRDVTVTRLADPAYADSMEIRVYTSSVAGGPWSLAVSLGPSDSLWDTLKVGDIIDPTLGPDIYLRIEMQPNLAGLNVRQSTPVFTGYQVASIPAPKRSRLVSVPIQVWDWEQDRNGQVTGRAGYAWERLSALEGLESDQATVQFTDYTTGEVRDAYVERVSFTRLTSPFRGQDNAGGVGTVLLRLL